MSESAAGLLITKGKELIKIIINDNKFCPLPIIPPRPHSAKIDWFFSTKRAQSLRVWLSLLLVTAGGDPIVATAGGAAAQPRRRSSPPASLPPCDVAGGRWRRWRSLVERDREGEEGELLLLIC